MGGEGLGNFSITVVCYVIGFVLIWKFGVSWFLAHVIGYAPNCVQISMIDVYFSLGFLPST